MRLASRAGTKVTGKQVTVCVPFALTDEIDWAAITMALKTCSQLYRWRLADLGSGRYLVNRPLDVHPSTGIVGSSSTGGGGVAATPAFSFPNDDTCVVRTRGFRLDSGAAPTKRMYLRGIYVGGSRLPGANGIGIQTQQPSFFEHIRVDECPGYGLGVSGTQQAQFTNTMLIRCGYGLRMRSAQFCWFYGFNVEQSIVSHILVENLAAGNGRNGSNGFWGVHFESSGSGPMIDLQDGIAGGWTFDNVIAAVHADQVFLRVGPNATVAGGPAGYTLRDVQFVTSGTPVAVDDATRGWTGVTTFPGSIGAGKEVLSSVEPVFTPADVGKRVLIAGAGPGGTTMDSFIQRCISPTQAKLIASARTAVSDAEVTRHETLNAIGHFGRYIGELRAACSVPYGGLPRYPVWISDRDGLTRLGGPRG